MLILFWKHPVDLINMAVILTLYLMNYYNWKWVPHTVSVKMSRSLTFADVKPHTWFEGPVFQS